MLVRPSRGTYTDKKPIGTSKLTSAEPKGWGSSSKEFGLFGRIVNLKDSLFLNFALLFAYPLILNRESLFVPSYTESHYLLHLAKLWNSNFLSNDWTFAALPSHFVFNFLFAPLTVLFPLEIVGWIGRILCWS